MELRGYSLMSQIIVSSGTTSVSTIDASNTYFVEGSGTLDILDGGLISSLVTVGQGGVALIASGGTTLSMTISSGGEQDVYGSAMDTTVSGGFEHVWSAGTV